MTAPFGGEAREQLERSLVSALLIDPSQILASAKLVGPGDFTDGRLALVFRELVALAKTGQDFDLIVLRDELDHAGVLGAIGGAAFLAELADVEATGAYAMEYARRLRLRSLRERERGLHARLASGSDDDEQATRRELARIEQELTCDGPDRSVLVSLASVEPRPVEWLWPGRIPRGKLTILDGDPNLGKSSITLDLAARITTGRAMPDGSPCGASGAVLLITYEDDLADTVRPRLDAAGADPERVFGFAVRDDDGERPPVLPHDLDTLERSVSSRCAVLVVIDPLMAALAGDVNAHRDQDVRRALSPLSKMAERTGAAVLVVRHLNKGGSAGSNAIYRGGGSIGIIGAARSGLLVGRDPNDAERRVLAVTKSNLSAPMPALGFRLIPTEVGLAIEWLGTTSHAADELLAVPTDRDDRSALDEARAFLTDFLQAGPQLAKDATHAARGAGIHDRTLQRGRRELGVMSRREGFGRGALYRWSLPPGFHARQVDGHARQCSPPLEHGKHGEHEGGEPSGMPT